MRTSRIFYSFWIQRWARSRLYNSVYILVKSPSIYLSIYIYATEQKGEAYISLLHDTSTAPPSYNRIVASSSKGPEPSRPQLSNADGTTTTNSQQLGQRPQKGHVSKLQDASQCREQRYRILLQASCYRLLPRCLHLINDSQVALNRMSHYTGAVGAR